jgi:hypothetical protein
MKNFVHALTIATILLFATASPAQIPSGFVQTTATVPVLAGGSFGASWTNLSSSPQLGLLGCVSTFQTTVNGAIDSYGHFSTLLADTAQICPAPSTWSFTLSCPAVAPGSFQIQVPITGGGGTEDISAQITAALPVNICNGSGSGGGITPITKGGTGSTTAAGAFTNIVAPGGTFTGPVTVDSTLNIGAPITPPEFSMEPLGTIPASWTLDVTTPGTALASLMSGGVVYPPPGTGTISAVLASNTKIVLSPGTYYDNLVLNNLQSVWIEGAGGGGAGIGTSEGVTILVPANTSLPAIELLNSGSAQGNSFITLKNFNLLCPATTVCADGLEVTGETTSIASPEGLNVMNVDGLTFSSGTEYNSNYGFFNDIDFNAAEVLYVHIDHSVLMGAMNDGITITNSLSGFASAVNDIHIDNSTIQNAVKYGFYFATGGAASIHIDHSVVQANNHNGAAPCAGVFINGAWSMSIDHSYFETNCAGSSDLNLADVRVTGTGTQNQVNAVNSIFLDVYGQWGYYNDALETGGVISGNTFSNTGHAVYVSTTHALSNVHIGENFGMGVPTIINTGSGGNEGDNAVSTTGPTGDNSTFVSAISGGQLNPNSRDIVKLYDVSTTPITTISGGYDGRLLKLYSAEYGPVILQTGGASPNGIKLMGGSSSESIPTNEFVTLSYSEYDLAWHEIGASSGYYPPVNTTTGTFSGAVSSASFLPAPTNTVTITTLSTLTNFISYSSFGLYVFSEAATNTTAVFLCDAGVGCTSLANHITGGFTVAQNGTSFAVETTSGATGRIFTWARIQ